MANRRQTGNIYESKAEAYLCDCGYVILERNYYCRYGEIDLIAKSPDGCVVFVEVKSRSNKRFGSASEALTRTKCEKIKRTSKAYIYEKKLNWDVDYRYDVITFQNDQLEHIVHAFY